MASSKKKNQPDNFKSLGARQGKKKGLKKGKKMKKIFVCFKQISQCDTCFYMHFSRTFQKYSF